MERRPRGLPFIIYNKSSQNLFPKNSHNRIGALSHFSTHIQTFSPPIEPGSSMAGSPLSPPSSFPLSHIYTQDQK